MNILKSHDLAPFHPMNAISLPLVDPTQNCYIKDLSLQIPTLGIYICSLHGWAPTTKIKISLCINYLLVFFFFFFLFLRVNAFWYIILNLLVCNCLLHCLYCKHNLYNKNPRVSLFFSLIICSLVTFCVILNVIIFSFLFLFDNLVYYFKFIGRGLILQFLLNKSERL